MLGRDAPPDPRGRPRPLVEPLVGIGLVVESWHGTRERLLFLVFLGMIELD